MRYEVYKDSNTKDWIVYDNDTNRNICHADTESEAQAFVAKLGTIKKVVDYMIKSGTEWTETGNYIFYHSELAHLFNLPVDWFRENHEVIKAEINSRPEVLSETWDAIGACGTPEGFDINFCLEYCDIEE